MKSKTADIRRPEKCLYFALYKLKFGVTALNADDDLFSAWRLIVKFEIGLEVF